MKSKTLAEALRLDRKIKLSKQLMDPVRLQVLSKEQFKQLRLEGKAVLSKKKVQ